MSLKITEIGDDDWVFSDTETSQSDFEILDRAIDFWHEGSYDLAENLLKNEIVKNTSNIDALHHLSMLYDDTSREFEAYLCCREAVRIGLDAIPKGFDWRKSQLNWYVHENRPFMRAYHFLGLWHQRRNEIELAITVFSRLLATCPNDNLGVRYILPKLWIDQGDYLSVLRLCKEYEDDTAPEITYTYPLVLVLLGEQEKAAQLFKKAKANLPLVAKELKKKLHPKPKSKMPGDITHGGAGEAYSYWKEYGCYWANSNKAMSLLSNG